MEVFNIVKMLGFFKLNYKFIFSLSIIFIEFFMELDKLALNII